MILFHIAFVRYWLGKIELLPAESFTTHHLSLNNIDIRFSLDQVRNIDCVMIAT